MRVEQRADGARVQLAEGDYRALCRATETYREEVVLRLGAEVGLRPAEMTRIRPADVRTHDHDGIDHYFLSVPESDDGARLAYLPPDVEHDLRQFARAENVAADARLIPVTPRRVQMLVREIASRTADRAGDDRFQEVSSRTLRQYFARHLLVEERIDPRIVQTVGGWDRIESLAPYLDEPTPTDVAVAFEETALAGGSAGQEVSDGDRAGRPTLDRLDSIIDGLRRVGSGLATASTREEVQRTACDRLAAVECYEFAWIADREGDGLNPVAHAGCGLEAVEAMAVPEGAVGTTLVEETVQATGGVHGDAAFAVWREYTDGAAAVIPVRDGDQTYGVLGIGASATDGIGDRERTMLADLGVRIGQAITAAEQRKFLLADTAVELAFESRDEHSFFAAASATHECSLTMEGVVPGEEQSLLYFVTLADAKPDTVVEWAPTTEAVTDARLVRDYGEEALIELVVDGSELSKALVEHGATVRRMAATAGNQEVVGEVPADTDVRAVVDDITAAFPDTELLTKRERERPAESLPAFRSSLRENLTEKQAAVLQAAYHAGYFEWPRGSTAEELADAIGITSPTLHNHLRRAQQKLLTSFYDETDHPTTEMPWSDT